MTTKKSFDPSAPALAGAGIYGLPKDRKNARVHLLPVPWEATTSYGGGTSRGPRAILGASEQVDLYDLDCGRVYEAGIFMLPESAAIRAANAPTRRAVETVLAAGPEGLERKAVQNALRKVNEASAKVNDLVRRAARKSLDEGKIVGLVGGDHSSPYGLIAELAERHPGLGILHFDAHHDLRVAYEGFEHSHASIMDNVMRDCPGVAKLVQVGIRDFCEEEKDQVDRSERRIIAHYDAELARAKFEGITFEDVASTIVSQLPEEVYVSFDVDGLDPRYCPNTGTPVPGGLDFNEAIHLLRVLAESGRRIVGFDLCEVAPGAKDEWDANVGARLLYKLIGFTLLSREDGEESAPQD
ncbi:MAG: agmatinase family protein [Planctomycetes bacterium]|nr:agmatinase family protein [Planctomycetota bacterium]